MNANECEVLVVGCGPTGVVLANLLGGLGVRVIVIEKDHGIYPIPRATHLDAETMRNLQATGLAAQLRACCAPFGEAEIVNEALERIFHAEVKDADSPHGIDDDYFFDQPSLEAVLREGLKRYPTVTLWSGVAAESIERHPDHVVLQGTALSTGETLRFKAGWVVGCDGGQSLVRQSLKTQMESLSPKNHWLIIDANLKHQEDLKRLPQNFRYYLKRARLALYAHGFGLHRRWEFQLEPDEAPSQEEALRWLSEYIDPARLELLRVTTYTHHALVASRWRGGRLLLAGDAAHMMPPFAGQGLCSGIRDALNLAWKLHRVINGQSPERLLDTYEVERRAHVREITLGALFINRQLQARTALQRLRRSLTFWALRSLGPLNSLFRRRAIRKRTIQQGFLGGRHTGGVAWSGKHLPQFITQKHQEAQRTDDALGYRLVLLAQEQKLAVKHLEALSQRGVALSLFPAQSPHPLYQWMKREGLDFALVRPDRIIFAAGSAANFEQSLRDLY